MSTGDEDFKRALQKAAPGVFIFESHWEERGKQEIWFRSAAACSTGTMGTYDKEQPEEKGKNEPS